MIVKVIKPGKAGSGRALAAYVLDLKHETKGERLGAYALDLKHGGEKVEWARTVNTGVDDPRWAVQAIEQHNAQNTRAHRISRYEHIVVSFAEGERPSREQMAVIEDRLMTAIGFGDHPRVSAVHKPDGKEVNNRHLHIAVSRIDPTTLKAEHPRGNHFTLQAEAAKLEIELGLRQERKTVLGREAQEIEALRKLDRERAALDQAADQRHQRAELERDARADRLASGDKATPADLAWQRNPAYRDAEKDLERLNKALNSAKWNRQQSQLEVDVSLYRREERWSQMSFWQKAAHNLKIRDDPEITYWERENGRAVRQTLRAEEKVRQIEGWLKDATGAAWKAYDRVKDDAAAN